MKGILAALFASFLILLPFGQEDQPQGLSLTTAFPSQVIPPGESLNLSLNLENAGLPAQTVDLEIVKAPQDWQVHFLGDGRVVRSVYLAQDGTRTISLKLEPPEAVPEGSYEFVLAAHGEDGDSQLTITLDVREIAPLQISFNFDLPIVNGTPGASMEFQGKLTNDSDQDLLVNLEADAPSGFQITFQQSFGSQEVTTVPVKAGATENVNVEVVPPDGLEAGEYPIAVRATAGEITDSADLTARVSGKPDLSIAGSDGRLSGNIYSGETSALNLVIHNAGTAAAENVSLSASQPTRWDVTFSPETIDRIEPGADAQFTANVHPSEQAVAGDYNLTFRAAPGNGSTESVTFRVTLLTSTRWGLVGLVLIAAALGVVALSVARFGRR